MTHCKNRNAVLTLLLLRCSVGLPVAADAQESIPAPIIVGVSVNESPLPVVCHGWPLLASVVIMNENAYQQNVPVTLAASWQNFLHLVVKNSAGNIVSWPFHMVVTADENVVLDSTTYAQIGYWLDASETNPIPLGEYTLTALLDSSAYAGPGSSLLSARSGPVSIRISAEPALLDIGLKTEKNLLFANLSILKGDDATALVYLSGILAYNAADLRTLVLTGSILESEGDYEGARYAYSRGVSTFYKTHPTAKDPPLELLSAQKALFYKLETAASFVVTFAAKDSTHPAYAHGSPFAYAVDNIPARELQLVRGKTYTFHAKGIPASDPLYFSTNPKGGGREPYTDGVNGTPAEGNGTVTITVQSNAPDVLYYQSSKSEYAGWRIDVADDDNVTSTWDKNSTLPRDYSLSMAYPNPFNPSTRIRYSLPKAAIVRLTVYDVLGRDVAILVDEMKEAGSYQVEWNPQLASGIYFYRIQVDGFVDTKKMIFLR